MRSRWVIPVFGVAVLVPGLYYYLPRMEPTEAMGSFESWTPTHKEIVSGLGPAAAGPYNDARHVRFGQMFQQRFRDHQFAVGVKFLPQQRLKTMFAPLVLRWDMARVASDALREARDSFGAEFTADIYETYITAPMKKLGEARFAAAGSDRVIVQFDPRFAAEQAAKLFNQRSQAPTRETGQPVPGAARRRPLDGTFSRPM